MGHPAGKGGPDSKVLNFSFPLSGRVLWIQDQDNAQSDHH